MEIEFCNPSIDSSSSYTNCFSQPIIQTENLESHIFFHSMFFNPDSNLLFNLKYTLSDCRLSDDFMILEKKQKLENIFINDFGSKNDLAKINYLDVLEINALGLLYSSSKSTIGFQRFISKVQNIVSNIELDRFTGKFINFPLIDSGKNNEDNKIIIDWRPAIVGLIQQSSSELPQKDILLSFYGGLVRALSEVVYWICVTNENSIDNIIDLKVTENHRILESVIQRLKNYRLKIKIP